MGRLVAALTSVRWYVSSLMGDNHYERYLAHRRAKHPGQPVMSEREYWRAKHDAADAQARCC
ncbi:YbdD/YjiX family protein [Gordonia sp. (in: high G+C Gram-positive bacteria)]|uniref:YbdD/YjiX family protein n=1 Tax=Gordonia sp. (in: high G+C Gram-positive bacteria) TaxID=84139 RepID=UPI0039E6D62A